MRVNDISRELPILGLSEEDEIRTEDLYPRIVLVDDVEQHEFLSVDTLLVARHGELPIVCSIDFVARRFGRAVHARLAFLAGLAPVGSILAALLLFLILTFLGAVAVAALQAMMPLMIGTPEALVRDAAAPTRH